MKHILLTISAILFLTSCATTKTALIENDTTPSNGFILSLSLNESSYRIYISGFDTKSTKNMILPEGGSLNIDKNLALVVDETGFYINCTNLFGETSNKGIPYFQKEQNSIYLQNKYSISCSQLTGNVEIKKMGTFKDRTLCVINKNTSISAGLTAMVLR